MSYRAARVRSLGAVVAASTILAGCNGFVGEWLFLDGFGAKFAKVQTGQSREQVVALLGKPARKSGSFVLPQREHHEQLYQDAAASHAVRYLYWNTGIDEVAVVGLDAESRVVFKCRAGT